MARCPHHRLMCHPHFHHHLHTPLPTQSVTAVINSLSQKCPLAFVSEQLSPILGKGLEMYLEPMVVFFFSHFFFYITNIYLWLDHTTSPQCVWPRDHCIDMSNQHQNDDDGHMATQWYKGLSMCLKPLLHVTTSPPASTQPTAQMCHPWERREHSPRDGQHVVHLLGF